MTTKQLQAIRELNAQGIHDREIARRLDLHWVCVGQARRDMGLPLVDGRKRNAATYKKQVVEMANEGFSDVQICVKVGIAESYVAQLRQEAGIKNKVGRKTLISKERLTGMVKAGMRSNEIARETGIKLKTIAEYRRRWGLNTAYTRRPPKEVLESMMAANMSQNEMANKIGCNVSSVRAWQRQYGLKQPKTRLEASWDMWRKTNTFSRRAPRNVQRPKQAAS